TLVTGQQLSGVVKSEDGKELRLMTPEGKLVVVKKDEIEERQVGKSAMPEDIVKYLSKRDVRDLVEFLAGLKEAPKTDKPLGGATVGECNYYFRARFRTPKDAEVARPRLAAFLAEGERAYAYWQGNRGIGGPEPSPAEFWDGFREQFPDVWRYLGKLAGS